MKTKTISTCIAAMTLGSAIHAQAQSMDALIKNSELDLNFRFRTEYVDTDTNKDAAFANTLKSRLTLKTAEVSGFSALIEGDNVFHFNDEFNDNENGKTQYNLVLDQETTQFNQAYIQYTGFESTVKLGNQRIVLDNQRHVGGVAWRQDEATFDALSIHNKSLSNTEIFAAFANNRNTITNDNTEESILLLNAKYQQSKNLALTGFYYSIEDANGTDELDFNTLGVRATGNASGFDYEAELATQSKETAGGGDFDTLYYHLAGSKKLGSVKTTLGYEVFGSDNGQTAFATPLGTNHKFFGWSDVFLTGAGNDGIQDIYASAASMISGIKLVAQFHHFNTAENNDALGNELGLMINKQIDHYGLNLKVAHYMASDFAENNLTKSDTTKVWFTASASF